MTKKKHPKTSKIRGFRGTRTHSFEALAPLATSESLEDEAKLSPTEVVARSRDSPAPASMPGQGMPWSHGDMAILWDPRFHLKWSDFLVGFFGNPTLERGTPILKNLMVTQRMSPGLQNPRLPGTIWDVGRELGQANGVFN